MKKATITTTDDLFERLKKEDVIVFDVETSGFSGKKHHLLSFSAIKLQYKDGIFHEKARFNQLFDPDAYIPADITELNHISNETVRGCPLEEECYDYIHPFIGTNTFLLGYNVGFDIRFVTAVFEKFGYTFKYNGTYDVLDLARAISGDGPENHKLETIAKYYKVADDLEFHNSIDDVIATYRILEVLLRLYPDAREMSLKTPSKEKAIVEKPSITSVQYWEKADKQRIYVNTKEVRGIYYDLITKVWIIPEGVDVDYIRKESWRVLNRQDNAAELKALIK